LRRVLQAVEAGQGVAAALLVHPDEGLAHAAHRGDAWRLAAPGLVVGDDAGVDLQAAGKLGLAEAEGLAPLAHRRPGRLGERDLARHLLQQRVLHAVPRWPPSSHKASANNAKRYGAWRWPAAVVRAARRERFIPRLPSSAP